MAALTDREFETIFGGKPPAKLQFFLDEDGELYHRELEGWRPYARPGAISRLESGDSEPKTEDPTRLGGSGGSGGSQAPSSVSFSPSE